MPRAARCPTCRKPVRLGEENAWRPFCSERCKLIDLGEWFGEEHYIAGQEETPWGKGSQGDDGSA